ncbi:predicted protein [Naegleria gruberi]|uniref:Predicted protein n=1 Tax=Naegleria gruberi TaxID=5762 RepID=D2V3Q0_NAEGR|nr:uncharacterized protein NAEGRDRAFT_63445 [Naegleria gruberi]EFC48812.1 predicted protein [Naegleria gruberi]|eukprot:XP_002681556.1 predicted protein [Naegleria gruberi strain NEG-M]
MSIELHLVGSHSGVGGTALDSSNAVDARYSRMSQEDDSSSSISHRQQHHHHHQENKRRGKLQTFIVGVRQCNPFAMFVALALLFILMGAIAFLTLILCILLIDSSPEPIVILVSIDAFRYDFVDKFAKYMPALSSLRKQGVTVGRMQPCFPTKTFPNHYSIATGQYVENHGLVSNSFYDRNAPFANKLFKQTLTDPYWWSQGEPIWITAEKQNVSTATYDYPGGNVKIQGIYPSFYEPVYIKESGFERRLGKIEQYLKMKRDKVPGAPSLIMYYVSWVDSAAHYYGVPDTDDSTTNDSAVFYNALKTTDGFIDGIMKKIDELGMKSRVNFLIVSDHGMLNLSADRIVWIRTMLEKYYNETQPTNRVDFKSVVTSNTVGTLVDMNVLVNSTDAVLKRNTINQLYTDLQETVKRYSLNCTIYKRDEIPAQYHYNKNERIPDILLISDPGYYSGLDSSAWWNERGDHGYRNDIDEMYAFFTGIGPKLKRGGVKAYEMIQNIHIHSLIAELLKIKPSTITDGNIENIKNVLSYQKK